MIIDTHAHLTSEKYVDTQKSIIEDAKKKMEKIIVIGCDEKEIDRAVALVDADKDNFLYAAIGIHPVDAKTYNEKIEEKIIENTKNDKVIAIGEIGLDYHWYPEEAEIQKKVFQAQIELAKKLNLPIIIHSREALEDTYEICKQNAPLVGVIHSFSGDAKEAEKFIELGLKIGISGPVTFKNGISQKDVAKKINLSEILLETDSPFLTPVPYRGKVNQPQYTYYVAEEIAFQKEISVDEVINETTKNAYDLFKGLKND